MVFSPIRAVMVKIDKDIYYEYANNLIVQEKIRKRIDDYEARLQILHMQYELEKIKEIALKESNGDVYHMGLKVVKELALRRWFTWQQRYALTNNNLLRKINGVSRKQK